MSDRFIDDLHATLQSERQQHVAQTAQADQRRQQLDAAKQAWFAEFVDVLGQKVGAWNEKGGAGGIVNFTKQPTGDAHVYHRNAEGEFRLEGDAVVSMVRFGGNAATGGPTIELAADRSGHIIATCERKQIASPTVAAEQMITPILRRAFEA